jgi:hypothetical protein
LSKICSNCGDQLGAKHVEAGKNHTKFCKPQCAYEGLTPYYTSEQVRKSIVLVTREIPVMFHGEKLAPE